VASVHPLELAADAATTVRRSRAERSKLRRELGRLDAVCLLIAAIVALDTLGRWPGAAPRSSPGWPWWRRCSSCPPGWSWPSSASPSRTRAAPMCGPGWPSGAEPGRWSRSPTSWSRPCGSAAPWPSPAWPSSTGWCCPSRASGGSRWRSPSSGPRWPWRRRRCGPASGSRWPAPPPRSGCWSSSPRPWPPMRPATASTPRRSVTWPPSGRCSPWSPPCWSTTSSASSCPRRPARSCATRPATFRRRSSAPACSPAPCTRCRCPAPLHRPPGRQRPFLPGRRRVLADLAPAGVQPPRRLLRPPRAGPGDRRRRPGRGRDHLPYPPGIPAIAPGELITTDLLEALRDEAHAGSRMAGASDPTLETVLVVRS